jgi:hypothetical protein
MPRSSIPNSRKSFIIAFYTSFTLNHLLTAILKTCFKPVSHLELELFL